MFINDRHGIKFTVRAMAQYLATTQKRNVKIFAFDIRRHTPDDYHRLKDDKVYERAVSELWDYVNNPDCAELFKDDGYYQREVETKAIENRNPYCIIEFVYTYELSKLFANEMNESHFEESWSGSFIIKDDDVNKVEGCLKDTAKMINSIGKGYFSMNVARDPEHDEIYLPRNKDVLDSEDFFGNKWELGDIVNYSGYLTPIVGIMPSKVLIGDLSRVDKGSCVIVKKHNGDPIKCGYLELI